jgi:hypothetical protein
VSVTLLEHDKNIIYAIPTIFAHTNVNIDDAVFVDRRSELFIAISYTRVRLILVIHGGQKTDSRYMCTSCACPM